MKTLWILSYSNFKLHKYLIISGLLALLVYGGYITYEFLISDNDAGNTLQLSSFLIQSGMLFFMLLGFQFAKKNIKNIVLHEVIGSRNIRKIHVVNIINLLIMSFLFVVLTIIFLLICYSVESTMISFAKETLLYLVHYWLLPFWIMGIVGYTFGINTNSKIIYVLLISIWTLVSPTNLQYFNNLLNNVPIMESIKWLENLNLGVDDLSQPYHAFFGFEYNWPKRISLFLIILTLCLNSVITLKNKKLQRLNLVIVIAAILAFSFYPNGYEKREIDNIERFIEDYKYYNNPSYVMKYKNLFNYEIESVDLKVENFDQFNVDAVMRISHNNQNKLAFTLYQGFTVSKVRLNNGKNITFHQEGDYVVVFLPVQSRNQIDLQITYSGKGSNFRPATSKYIYLPADFRWVPSNQPSMTHFMFNDDMIPSSEPSPKINYTLKYSGSKKLDYINLTKKDSENFEGRTSGISLILGNITTTRYNEQIIYYPSSWTLYNNDLKKYLNKFNHMLKKYNGLFNTNFKLPNEIILLPNMDINSNYSYMNSFGDDDHIILQINPVGLTKLMELNEVVPYQIERAFVKRGINNVNEYAAWFVYNSLLGSYLNHKEHNIPKSALSRMYFQLSLAESSIESKYLTVYQRLFNIDWNTLSDDFFIEWKEILSDHNKNDWEQLEALLSKEV